MARQPGNGFVVKVTQYKRKSHPMKAHKIKGHNVITYYRRLPGTVQKKK